MANLNLLTREGKKPYRRVGRGQSSTRGKQSGRGGKGQTARAGNKRRPEMRDIIKKLPKRRGYGKNRARTVDASRLVRVAVSLSRLDTVFESGAEITRAALLERGILGRRQRAKIVGGETSKKFTIKDCTASSSALAAIEKAGGSVVPEVSKTVKKVKPAKKVKAAKAEKPAADTQ
jgi:large subunit ribosomal protein L15